MMVSESEEVFWRAMRSGGGEWIWCVCVRVGRGSGGGEGENLKECDEGEEVGVLTIGSRLPLYSCL